MNEKQLSFSVVRSTTTTTTAATTTTTRKKTSTRDATDTTQKVEWAENAARGDFPDLLKLRRKHFSRSHNFFSFCKLSKMLSLKDTKSNNHQRSLKDADVLQNNQKQEQASDLGDSHRQTEACSASSSVTSSLSSSTSSREHGKRQRQSVSFQTGLRRAKRR